MTDDPDDGSEPPVKPPASAGELGCRAERMHERILGDPGMPAHLHHPMFENALRSWARAEAASEMLGEYVARLTQEDALTPRGINGRSPLEIWMKAAKHALLHRTRIERLGFKWRPDGKS